MAVKIDVTQQLQNLDGGPIPERRTCEKCSHTTGGKPFTLRDICTNALMSTKQGAPPEGKEQVERYELALRIKREDLVELSNAEAGKIQELIADIYMPLITGQCWLMLEGDDTG